MGSFGKYLKKDVVILAFLYLWASLLMYVVILVLFLFCLVFLLKSIASKYQVSSESKIFGGKGEGIYLLSLEPIFFINTPRPSSFFKKEKRNTFIASVCALT